MLVDIEEVSEKKDTSRATDVVTSNINTLSNRQTENVSMLTERLPMLTKNVHLVPLQGHVTCLLMINGKSFSQSVSKRRCAPSLSDQGG